MLRLSGSRPTAVAPRPLRPESAATPTTTMRWPMSGSLSSAATAGVAARGTDGGLRTIGAGGCGSGAAGAAVAAGTGAVGATGTAGAAGTACDAGNSKAPAALVCPTASLVHRLNDALEPGEPGSAPPEFEFRNEDALRARASAGLMLAAFGLPPPRDGEVSGVFATSNRLTMSRTDFAGFSSGAASSWLSPMAERMLASNALSGMDAGGDWPLVSGTPAGGGTPSGAVSGSSSRSSRDRRSMEGRCGCAAQGPSLADDSP